MKRILKMIAISIISIIALFIIGVLLFINTSPEFGSGATGERLARMKSSPYYTKGKFINAVPTVQGLKDWKDIPSVLYKFIKKEPHQEPDWEIPVNKIDSLNITNTPDSLTQLTWFGHSAFLLEMDGKKILIDPMLGDVPSPVAFMANKRFNLDLPIAIEQLPKIDAIIISHDHYDHLDYGSIKALKEKTDHFYVPLGVGAHLEGWGVPASDITELAWWEESKLDQITLAATPARHFSGRGLSDSNSTHWASWVIKGHKDNIYFSGDSGYFDGFKEIGDKYGPFDIAMVECGQYNDMWADIHMVPEESAQVGLDVRAKTIMPIHWGAFKLSLHTWTDPVERITIKAKELGVNVTTPEIGKTFVVNGDSYPKGQWWVRE
jgi:L-ascorbate metabolism protein UlaG (beta-lactamase superfamily)